jgi:hypothetical protein
VHRVKGLPLFGILATLVLDASGNASASEALGTEEHRALMISAQVMKKEGKLLRSRDLLGTCGGTACTEGVQSAECEEIRAFCEKRLAEVLNDIPTVSLRVLDDRGLPVHAELLELDAVAVDASKPVPLDPGAHVAKAVYAGRQGETGIVLERGQKDVSILLRIDLRETVPRRPIPTPVYVLGATTLAAGLLATATGVYTVRSYQGLDGCAPLCNPSQKPTLQATSYVADISTLVAIASAVTGTIWFLGRPTVNETRWLRPSTTTEEGEP